MPTRTISISEEAYSRLKILKKEGKMSFSEVIINHYPKRKTLSEVLNEIGESLTLADTIEKVSKELREERSHEVSL